MLKVGSLLTRELVSVQPGCTLESARALMRDRGLKHLLVVEGERLAGVLSDRDLMTSDHAFLGRVAETPPQPPAVRDHMSTSLEFVSPEVPLLEACRRMYERRIACLPAVHEGRPLGVLTESDLLRLYLRCCRFHGPDAAFDPLVEEWMSRDVVALSADHTAAEAYELMRTRRIRHLAVMRGPWLEGILSDRDLLPTIGRGDGESKRVADLMTRDFVAVAPGTPLSGAARCMEQNSFHCLPVLEDQVLEGMITSADVLAALSAIEEADLDEVWFSEQRLQLDREEE
jgi:CBS domain-containing protein